MPTSQPAGDSYGVFLVEDDARTRAALSRQIDACEQLWLMGAAGSVAEARIWRKNTTQVPRVLLTDLGLPDGSGVTVIKETLHQFPSCEALVLSKFGDDDHVLTSIEAGALGYIQKDASAESIAETVLELIAGGSPISPGIARRLLTRHWPKVASVSLERARQSQSDEAGSGLTLREIEVLTLLTKGFSYLEIAKLHKISRPTVATHIRNLYCKLSVHSRSEAVFEALQTGIVLPPQ